MTTPTSSTSEVTNLSRFIRQSLPLEEPSSIISKERITKKQQTSNKRQLAVNKQLTSTKKRLPTTTQSRPVVKKPTSSTEPDYTRNEEERKRRINERFLYRQLANELPNDKVKSMIISYPFILVYHKVKFITLLLLFF